VYEEENEMKILKNNDEERRKKKDGKLKVEVAPQLTARDLTAIAWLVEQRAATLPQLTTLLGYLGAGEITLRRGAQLVSRWEQLGLVERSFVWHREPAVLWPTTAGAKLVGLPRWRRPAVGTLRHTIATSAVRLRSCRPWNDRTWLTEQQLRELLPKGVRIPDGAIVEPDGVSITACEVELTSHGRRRVREAMTSLLAARSGDNDWFHYVLYLCSEETIHQCKAVRAELPEHLRARVVVLACPT